MPSQGSNRSRNTDRNLVSDEPYEVEYIHKQFPNHSHEEVARALSAAKAELKGSESREKIMSILKRTLK
jgi:hypothetical protein